jgi:hypothetical protein
VAPCVRCGTFLCGACIELMGEAAYCEDCLAWLHKNSPPSRAVQGVIALSILGIAAFPLCMMLAPVLNLAAALLGLRVSTRELRRIRQGDGPLRGTWQAKVARVLGAVNLLLVLLWGVTFFYAMRQSGLW